MLTFKVKVPDNLVISAQDAAEAVKLAVEELITQHLIDRDASAQHRPGFPKSDYWKDAAESVTSTVSGSKVTIDIPKEGAYLHFYGGTVYPKKKALAIPIDPAVADIWPSEAGGELDVFWPKNASHGFLKDPETSDLLWLLVPKATIPADRTVLPEDAAIEQAVLDAIWGACA